MGTSHNNGSAVIARLTDCVMAESFAKLPGPTVRAAPRTILDSLGVTLGWSFQAPRGGR